MNATVEVDGRWVGPTRPYDIVKEFVIALVVVALLTILLAAVFSSPDVRPVTISSWSRGDPADFVATAISELDGSSASSTYGPPYNHTPGAGQKIFGVSLQRLAGVRIPVHPANDFVLHPLEALAPSVPGLAAAISQYAHASPQDQKRWTDAYGKALDHATFDTGAPVVPPGDYGPVEPMMAALLLTARSGGLDGALLTTKQFYATDYTKPLLFMSDSAHLQDLAKAQHLLGGQWGMMNETGNWPGQAWLWLYTLWYQIPPFKTSGNADALIWCIMAVLTLLLLLLPIIPGLRSLPRYLRVHRLIWRDYYRSVERQAVRRE